MLESLMGEFQVGAVEVVEIPEYVIIASMLVAGIIPLIGLLVAVPLMCGHVVWSYRYEEKSFLEVYRLSIGSEEDREVFRKIVDYWEGHPFEARIFLSFNFIALGFIQLAFISSITDYIQTLILLGCLGLEILVVYALIRRVANKKQ